MNNSPTFREYVGKVNRLEDSEENRKKEEETSTQETKPIMGMMGEAQLMITSGKTKIYLFTHKFILHENHLQ